MINKRLNDWLTGSLQLANIYEELVPICQSLGRMDVELIEMDRNWLESNDEINITEIHCNEDIAKRCTLSYLWLLGMYEIIRILKNWAKHHSSQLEEIEIVKVYKKFAHLRMPLGKLEKAGKKGEKQIAWPGFSIDNGMIGWSVDNKKFVSRKELADNFIELLNKLGQQIAINEDYYFKPKQIICNFQCPTHQKNTNF